MRYDTDTHVIRLSVRELCERALRSGDLDAMQGDGYEAADIGAELHRRIQAELLAILVDRGELGVQRLFKIAIRAHQGQAEVVKRDRLIGQNKRHTAHARARLGLGKLSKHLTEAQVKLLAEDRRNKATHVVDCRRTAALWHTVIMDRAVAHINADHGGCDIRGSCHRSVPSLYCCGGSP